MPGAVQRLDPLALAFQDHGHERRWVFSGQDLAICAMGHTGRRDQRVGKRSQGGAPAIISLVYGEIRLVSSWSRSGERPATGAQGLPAAIHDFYISDKGAPLFL